MSDQKRPYGLYYGKLPDEVRARALELAGQILPDSKKIRIQRKLTPPGAWAWAVTFPVLSTDTETWRPAMANFKASGLYPDVCASYGADTCDTAFIGAILWKPPT